MSVDEPGGDDKAQSRLAGTGALGPVRPWDTSEADSRPSKTKCQGPAQGGEPPKIEAREMPTGTPHRPLTATGRSLRDELRLVAYENGDRVPVEAVGDVPTDAEIKPRSWLRAVNEWRRWYAGYESAHIEYEGPDGSTARTRLENSYQPRYGKRYYARLKDLERGIGRRWSDVTTVMLTLTASHENANGRPRCPADHMRDVQDGWDTARKRLYNALSDCGWEYATVWEPHDDGYGHMHVAVFIEASAEDVAAEDFQGVMEAYTADVDSAAWDAHKPDESVSVRGVSEGESDGDDGDDGEIGNVGSYISEYIGVFGDRPLDRPSTEQIFYATTWATGTRRVRFSEGANDIIRGEQFRRETGLKPENRGESGPGAGSESGGAHGSEVDDGGEEAGEGESWDVVAIERVRSRTERQRYDPTTGGADFGPVAEANDGYDPPKDLGPPPGWSG